jgi:hypothetical protein
MRQLPSGVLEPQMEWRCFAAGLDKGEVQMVLQEASEAIPYSSGQGMPVKLRGVGASTPSVVVFGLMQRNGRYVDRIQAAQSAAEFAQLSMAGRKCRTKTNLASASARLITRTAR